MGPWRRAWLVWLPLCQAAGLYPATGQVEYCTRVEYSTSSLATATVPALPQIETDSNLGLLCRHCTYFVDTVPSSRAIEHRMEKWEESSTRTGPAIMMLYL